MVKKVIKNCNTYIKNKLNCYALYKLIKLLDILVCVWKLIALNFITKLLLLINLIISIKYNVILIIINKFTKYIYFLF